MVVELNRTATTGGDISAGQSPKVSLISATGKIDDDVKAAMTELENRGNPSPVEAGGTFKFVSSSNSSVTLSESFDRLLVVGYVGFDIPVFEDGSLGAPLPTFERIENLVKRTASAGAGQLGPAQRRYKLEEAGLDHLADKNPQAALKVMTSVTETLKAPQFYKVAVELRRIAALDSQDKSKEIKDALSMFKSAATSYVAVGGTGGPRYATYSQTLADAFDRR